MNAKLEYPTMRCCMCPNLQENKTTCPGITGTSHPLPDSCRFVKSFIDDRGWKYRVMSGIGENSYKARYQKPREKSWKGLHTVPWRKTFDEAQTDLNVLATQKGWLEYSEIA